jgi:hypothetical protein
MSSSATEEMTPPVLELGLTVSTDLPTLGYRGVESCDLLFDGYGHRPVRCSAARRATGSHR